MIHQHRIHCLGISHKSAGVMLRESLSFSAEKVAEVLQAERENGRFLELAILSTCNRLEVYAVLPAEADGLTCILNFLSEAHRLPSSTFVDHTYHYTDLAAANHLCRVAAGLDSIVLGEPQILGQVIRSFEWAQAQKTAASLLTTLFRGVIFAGKRARTETRISQLSLSLSGVALQLAAKRLGELPSCEVVVVGAGEMAELAVKGLNKRNVKEFTVFNRSVARAEQLAVRYGGRARGLKLLPYALATADLLISATGAQKPVIVAEQVAAARADSAKPLVIVDLAVPRDVETAVSELPNVLLVDVDGLQGQVDDALAERQAQVPQVEAIINIELARLAQKLRAAQVRPLISGLRQRAEQIRQQEVARMLHHLPEADDATKEQVQRLTRALVNKLLHEPTMRLRQEAENGRSSPYAETVRYLFDLEEN